MEDDDYSLKCPIGLELFSDPVVGADGHTYERENITAWLRIHGSSPLTREPMTDASLRPNYLVRKLVEEFLRTSREKQYQFRLNVDVRESKQHSWFVSSGKMICKAEWIGKAGPPIQLLKMDGVRACREASFYVDLSRHPHILRTFGLVHSELGSVCLLQEFTSHGDLSYQMREQEFYPSARVLLEIFAQMIDALICLANNGIVHGHVAARNVLAFRLHSTEPEHNLFKLTDFGLTKASTIFSAADEANDTTILSMKSIRYCAPEILRKKDGHLYHTEKSDVHSMGVLMWEAQSQGQLPFASIENDAELRRARRSGAMLERPQSCNAALWLLINSCWNINPDDRPSFKELKHEILNMCDGSNRSTAHESSSTQEEDVVWSSNDTQLNSTVQYSDSSDISRSLVNRNNQESRTKEFETACIYCHEYYPSRHLVEHEVHCPYKEDSNDRNTSSLPFVSQHADRSDCTASALMTTTCLYCRRECSLDVIDIHEEICGFPGLHTPMTTQRRAVFDEGRQPDEERKRGSVTSSTGRKPTTTSKSTSTRKTNRNREITAADPAFLQLFEMITEDLDKFVSMTIPKGLACIQCRITRGKGDVYFLHAERPNDDTKFFLLAGRKRRWHAASTYAITTDVTDLTKDGPNIGAVRAKNLLGTEFSIYQRDSYDRKGRATNENQIQLAAVGYETNVLGFKGPRKMRVLLPEVFENNERVEFRAENESESLLERWKQHNMNGLLEYHNKAPVFYEEYPLELFQKSNEYQKEAKAAIEIDEYALERDMLSYYLGTQSYALNFNGRVTMASVKNFQLVHEDDPDHVCLQFGRVARDTFTCDYRYPLCAIQAFGIVLSSFDSKLACE